jgi:hypothetical protein
LGVVESGYTTVPAIPAVRTGSAFKHILGVFNDSSHSMGTWRHG